MQATRAAHRASHHLIERCAPRPLQGFDEYMNLVLDEAEEVNAKKGTRKKLGRCMLKGENITLMQEASPSMSD